MRIEFFGDEVEAIAEIDPLRGEVHRAAEAGDDLPGEPLRRDRRHPEARRRRHPRGAAASGSPTCASGKLLEAQRLEQRTLLRPRDARADGLLPRHRELLALPRRARGGRAAATRSSTTSPKDFLARRRREPRDRAADRRDVPRRPRAQGDARRVRLPPAVGARQPAAPASRSGEERVRAGHLRLGDARRLRAREVGGVVVEQIIRPTGLIDPAVEVRPAAGQVDDLLDEIRDAGRGRRARPRHDAHEAHGRGADRLLHRARASASATCTPTSTRSSGSRSSAICAWASSTCSSGSTSCARGSTSPRSRSWRSSTRTRRASSARRDR